MKKTSKNPKRLMLSTETVRKLDDAQLKAVAGGLAVDCGETRTYGDPCEACDGSVKKPK